MKKYVVRNRRTQQVFGRFDTQKQASEKLIEYITENNKNRCPDDVNFLSVFDFYGTEEETREITSYKEACSFLGFKSSFCAEDDNIKHSNALRALAKLFTIAEAWNKEDSFVPDFLNEYQRKYFPCFEYDRDATGFVYSRTAWADKKPAVPVGSRLCFATYERAMAFGKQFQDLYNDFLL